MYGMEASCDLGLHIVGHTFEHHVARIECEITTDMFALYTNTRSPTPKRVPWSARVTTPTPSIPAFVPK